MFVKEKFLNVMSFRHRWRRRRRKIQMKFFLWTFRLPTVWLDLEKIRQIGYICKRVLAIFIQLFVPNAESSLEF